MKTTLKEIGISIVKGIIYLVRKIINAEIDTKKIQKVIMITVVIVVLTFFTFLILDITFNITGPQDPFEEWLRGPWREYLEDPNN